MAVAAWASGALCAVVAARHVAKLERFVCPGATELAERAERAVEGAPDASRAELARAELALMRDEAGRTLALATLLPRSMARIALATGTALGVLALAVHAADNPSAASVGAVAAFAGGMFGSMASMWFGRRASELASKARSDWKRALAGAEAELDARKRSR